MRRRKKIHSVVTPTEFPGKIRDRHHLDHRDSNARQLRQLFRRGAPGALGRKCADVHFVDNLAFQRDARPLRVGPFELSCIDDA